MRPENSRCGMIKIPPCSKALSAEIYSPSPLMISEIFLSGT
jgi:hypothetical protein